MKELTYVSVYTLTRARASDARMRTRVTVLPEVKVIRDRREMRGLSEWAAVLRVFLKSFKKFLERRKAVI